MKANRRRKQAPTRVKPESVYSGWFGGTCPDCEVKIGDRHLKGCVFGPHRVESKAEKAERQSAISIARGRQAG